MGKYVAVFVDKLASQDFKDTGCEAKSRCIFAQQINEQADTIPELLKKLADTYGYDGDYWFIPEGGGSVSFNQHEDLIGTPLTPREIEVLWDNCVPVYLCDYTFVIEYQECRDVTEGELRDAVQQMGATCD